MGEFTTDLAIETEIRRFERKSHFNKKQYLFNYGSEMPLLLALYCRLHSIPAGNSSIERLFLQARRVYNDLKNQTSPISFEAQMIIISNKHIHS